MDESEEEGQDRVQGSDTVIETIGSIEDDKEALVAREALVGWNNIKHTAINELLHIAHTMDPTTRASTDSPNSLKN